MNVPSTLAALGGDRVRRRLPELAAEALMVVFAVLVALGVEEWREERQLRAFADRARAAVDQEIELNLDEFRSTESNLVEGSETVATVLRALLEVRDSGESGSVEHSFTFSEPEITGCLDPALPERTKFLRSGTCTAASWPAASPVS